MRQVIGLDPEDMWSHMWLGVAYVGLGHDDEGRAEIIRLNAMRKERSGKNPIRLSIASSFDLLPADAARLRTGLDFTGVWRWSAPPRVPPGDRLQGEELRALVRVPYRYGGDPGSGTEYWSFTNPQNVWESGGTWGIFSPRPLIIENDQTCFQIDRRKTCSLIYRNPQGTRENNDEYIDLRLWNGEEWLFSAYEERPPALKGKSFND